MTNMGPWDGYWVGTGIALPASTQSRTTPGTPSHPGYTAVMHEAGISDLNMAVGLKSVDQLTLGAWISENQGITEVYNLVIAGRIINHFPIPGTD